jgi:hypothetical protein
MAADIKANRIITALINSRSIFASFLLMGLSLPHWLAFPGVRSSGGKRTGLDQPITAGPAAGRTPLLS